MDDSRIIENTITHEKIIKSNPIDEEVFFDGGAMITETDAKGVITYANRKFREMSGYSNEELIGSPHSINRHPDMPVGVFRGMWKIIVTNKKWRGYVKNLRKDGKFYWVLLYIQPRLDKNGKIIGYTGVRKIAYPEAVKKASELYAKFHDAKYINHDVFLDEGYHDYMLRKG